MLELGDSSMSKYPFQTKKLWYESFAWTFWPQVIKNLCILAYILHLESSINDYSTRKEGTAGDSNTKGGTKSINFQNHILQLAWGMFNVPLVPSIE
jgi:hypothetical protein